MTYTLGKFYTWKIETIMRNPFIKTFIEISDISKQEIFNNCRNKSGIFFNIFETFLHSVHNTVLLGLTFELIKFLQASTRWCPRHSGLPVTYTLLLDSLALPFDWLEIYTITNCNQILCWYWPFFKIKVKNIESLNSSYEILRFVSLWKSLFFVY